MSAIDMTKIYKEYRGLWIAMDKDREVVASGEDGEQVYKTARAKGIEVPFLYHVPNKPQFFVGLLLV
ncbi:hypothetical protein HY477_02220 [Candidatus Uhrbacteria bacterium]|nr:hypothetical protein [Candidatus Uhrbacteria bacterium]